MKHIIIVLVSALLFSACQSGKKFTSRKYMSGRYVSHGTHKEKISKDKQESQRALVAVKNNESRMAERTPELEKENTVTASVDFKASEKKSLESKSNNSSVKTNFLQKNRVYEPLKSKIIKKLEYKKVQLEEKKVGTKSLVSVILSGLGIVTNVFSVIIAVASLEYIFLSFLVIGLVLGIIRMILGFQGIKEYKRERSAGNKHTPALVMGIIGASVGLAAIITAAVFALYGAILIAFAF